MSTGGRIKSAHLAAITDAIPRGYNDCSPDLIAGQLYEAGVRATDPEEGITGSLRQLISGLAVGNAEPADLHTALTILEVRLDIPVTATAGDFNDYPQEPPC